MEGNKHTESRKQVQVSDCLESDKFLLLPSALQGLILSGIVIF